MIFVFTGTRYKQVPGRQRLSAPSTLLCPVITQLALAVAKNFSKQNWQSTSTTSQQDASHTCSAFPSNAFLVCSHLSKHNLKSLHNGRIIFTPLPGLFSLPCLNPMLLMFWIVSSPRLICPNYKGKTSDFSPWSQLFPLLNWATAAPPEHRHRNSLQSQQAP